MVQGARRAGVSWRTVGLEGTGMTAMQRASVAEHSEGTGGSPSPPVALGRYLREIELTDQLPVAELNPVLMGLFGEVGGILSALKKHVRDQESYPNYDEEVEEEFGDALWYFAALCRRLSVPMDSLTTSMPSSSTERNSELLTALLELGKATARLLRLSVVDTADRDVLCEFWARYTSALRASNLDLPTVAGRNLYKASGRFLSPDLSRLPTFDEAFPPDERLPEIFEITVRQRPSGQTWLSWNGVFIGDPLTDNISDRDGYRFHDIFHMAHAAILHWSPTFRAVIKHKRKSCPEVDEAQDGGRAIVVEEGLTAWIFSRAKQLDFFENQTRLSFDLLKTVEQFVRGYEVERCPLNLWERAILSGYAIFRQVLVNGGGLIVGDRRARTIDYRPLTAGPV